MKTTTLSAIFFFFISLLAIIHSSTAEEKDCDVYLCDEDWEYVKAGQPYRFGPPIVTDGGDIAVQSTYDAIPCPRKGVVVDRPGDSFIFNPIVPEEKGRVRLETAISISIAGDNKVECNEETGVLQMKRRSSEIYFWHVTADGKANTSASCFQFLGYAHPSDPAEQSYWLQNCPYMCGRGTIGYCQTVGARIEGSKTYLSTTKTAYELSIRAKGDLDHASI